MPNPKLILITGRSTKQGVGISIGKGEEGYQEATGFIELSSVDMEKSGLKEGDRVKIRSAFGEATVRCRPQELPEGMAFLAFGPASSQVVGGETHASGMPDTKGIEIELERLQV